MGLQSLQHHAQHLTATSSLLVVPLLAALTLLCFACSVCKHPVLLGLGAAETLLANLLC
jgi:hypothetical protein